MVNNRGVPLRFGILSTRVTRAVVEAATSSHCKLGNTGAIAPSLVLLISLRWIE